MKGPYLLQGLIKYTDVEYSFSDANINIHTFSLNNSFQKQL